MRTILLILAIMIGFGTHAEARHAHHHRYHHHYHHAHRYNRIPAVHSLANTTMLPHPAGCPHVAFCGCGAALDVFGHDVRELWLAANWYKFPRAEPAPGMVAVVQHHVSVLAEHIQGSVWMVKDYNGGQHQSYLHPRNIASMTIVNPHGGASNTPRIVHHQERTYRGYRNHLIDLGISNRAADRASVQVSKHPVNRNLRVKPFSWFDLTR